MDRQTAAILEGIFGGIAAIFMILWMILIVEYIFLQDTPSSLSGLLFILYSFLMIMFLIPTSIFGHIKKNIDKQQKQPQPVQNIIYVPQQQQQQQLVVNIPQPYIPPEQEIVHQQPIRPVEKEYEEEPIDGIYCINCGFKNVRHAKFCKACGATIE